MSLFIAKEIHCDGCGEWMRLETGRMRVHWPELAKEGWTREAGQHWCPQCGLHGSWENHPPDPSIASPPPLP